MIGSLVLNMDMIFEVFSYIPASELGKIRVLNKECNKRSYESWFINLNLHRTNSNFGYIFETNFVLERKDKEVSINFLPPGGRVEIEACDASHGILLCVKDTEGSPEYIVCKPTTKQYQIIPNPTLLCLSISFGLVVIQSNPFRYKILSLSKISVRNRSLRTLACQVFDSDSFMWKRLKDLRLPKKDGFLLSQVPVQAYGCLHWLSRNNNVIRFCLKTETWCFFQAPSFGVSPELVSYKGKLGVIRWSSYEGTFHRLWVLKSSFGKSWEKVKDMKNMGLIYNMLWIQRNDVVTLSNRDGFCFYNINTEETNTIHIPMTKEFACFPFCSDYESVEEMGS